MADPSTLEADIAAVLAAVGNGAPLARTKTAEFAVYKFLEGIRSVINNKLFDAYPPRTVASKRLWPSEVGRPCTRALWYKMRPEYPKEHLRPETVLKFIYGDMLEHLVLLLCRLAGHDVSDEQARVEVKLGNGWTCGGKIDARVDGVLTDVKSASSRSMDKFKSGDMGDDLFGYNGQLDVYAQGEEIAQWLAIDKSLGHIVRAERKVEPLDAEHLFHVTELLEQPDPPARPTERTTRKEGANVALAPMCAYCDHKQVCWADANEGAGLRKFLYSRGPVWLTEVKKLPQVPEISDNVD